MKKIKNMVWLFLITLILTGCIKMETTMDIKKDKSMDFKIIFAIQSEDENNVDYDEESMKEYKEKGFKIEDYNEDGKKGYIISKEIKNIDEISINGATIFDLSKFLDGDPNMNSMFEVKKGFFKNTYKAKVITQNEQMENLNSTSYESNDLGISDVDFSQLKERMDVTFNVKLPYAAVSNNATKVSDENKSLSWNLMLSDMQNKNCEFEFYIYNLKNIYMLIGALVIVILLILSCAFTIFGNKNKMIEEQVNDSLRNQEIVQNSDTSTISDINSTDNKETQMPNDGDLNNMEKQDESVSNEKQQEITKQNEQIENYFNVGSLESNVMNDVNHNNDNNQNGI